MRSHVPPPWEGGAYPAANGHQGNVQPNHDSQPYSPPQQPYRDPWLTGGWFARLLDDGASDTGQKQESTALNRRWPIIVILLIQAALSVRFFRANSNSPAEGSYLWTGYLDLGRHAQASQIAGLDARFSGSQAFYPRVGALAAEFGGLAGARALSLVFMLIATAALYETTRRLWSSAAPAVFATALFGWLGAVQVLGALATNDAMSLALLAVATWIGVRAAALRAAARLPLLVAAAALLLLANATGYVSGLFDPIVIAVLCLASWRIHGWTTALVSGLVAAVATAVLVFGAHAIKFATLTSPAGDTSAARILAADGRWIGLLAALAVAAAIAIMWRQRDAVTALLAWVLAGAAIASTLLQARLHTTLDLYQDAGFGAWFASAAAGWLLAYLFVPGRHRLAPALGRGIAILAVLASAGIGVTTSVTRYLDWPDSSPTAAELAQLVRPNGEYLAEDYYQFAFTLRSSISFPQWSDTSSFDYRDPRTRKLLRDDSAYAAAIKETYFSVIVLDFQDTVGTDEAIEQDIKKYGDYRVAATIPFTTSSVSDQYRIWVPVAKSRQG
jgi:hypothetical protein